MKITCSCGIDYQVYDYPPAEVEEGGKKMMERHIMCPCDREAVIRTQPKYEPNVDTGEETSGVVSFDELVRRLDKAAAAAPAPAAPAVNPGGWGGNWGPPTAQKAPPKAPVAPPVVPSPIIDPNAVPVPSSDEKSLFLNQDEADVVSALIAHYGAKFKDAEVQKEEVQEFADLASRAKQEGMFAMSEKEQRMVRMAFLERNVKKLWPIAAYADETEFEVQQTAKAKILRERFKTTCEWDK